MPGAGLEVVVVGAGVGGLGTALALGRAGHRVTLVERDATPMPADPLAAFGWDRRGAPQVRHSHALLARLRNLLRDRYPDVLAALLDAGATEIRFTDLLPPEMEDREPRPGDEDLVALACRRTTFEWVLRATALAEPEVRLLDGVAATGLITDGGDGGPVHVRGVRGTGDGPTELLADLVVIGSGRRSALPGWLAEAGVELPVTEEDTGMVYFSRFYRLRPAAAPPDGTGPIGGDLGYLKYAVFQGDNGTWSVTLAVADDDVELRRALPDPATFDRAAGALPATTAWVDPVVAEPITEVHVMAGLLNRRVEFTDGTGQPLALGLHAVGDAHTCTNPLYGRGCSLAMVQATLLADAVANHANDPRARAVAYESACAEHIEPWYAAAVAQDRLNRSARPGNVDAPAGGAEGADTGELSFHELFRHGLLPAVRLDPVVFRAFVRGFNLLEAPNALLADPDVTGRVLATYQSRHQRPPEPPLGPPRGQLTASLTSPP